MRTKLPLFVCALMLVVSSDGAIATITQVDGTILPTLRPPGDTDLQDVFDAIPEPIDAVLDAAELPEVFLPNTSSPVLFADYAEFAGFENTFGWYNVGDDVITPVGRAENLHPVLGACVPMVAAVGPEAGLSGAVLLTPPHNQHHHGDPSFYVQNAEPGSSVAVDFGAEQAAGRYKGGFIAFYLVTPQDNAAGTNACGDDKVDGSGDSYMGRIYYTQKDLNDDGDFVHHLVYTASSAPDRFYFAFEDLFRGGDNDFTDMTIQVNGLTPPCVPETEICDSLDNDCDGLVDEADPDLSGVGAACACDGGGMTCQGGARQGECQTGITVCVGGGLECQSTVAPSSERCDGLDNNCDGTVDDNPVDVGDPCDGPDADLCEEGQTVCTSGVVTCDDATGPNQELCNGVDDDCNGATDDSPVDVGAPCDGADTDLCVEGVTVCAAGVPVCGDATGSTGEVCNGLDDDCNGTVDDSPSDVGGSCSAGIGSCQRNGAFVCSGGSPVCNATPGTPSPESCNGLDDDCDVAIDEDFGVGAACDGVGECGPGVLECDGPAGTRCSTDPGGSGDESRPEICNGLDDDCDGEVDEGLSSLGACGTNVGVCSEGTLRCVGGAPVCEGGVGPTPEVCDALDNDCDGLADELTGDPGDVGGGLVDVGAACGSGVGACIPGTVVCVGGSLDCDGAVGGGPEVCNGLDDDCNGIADDSPTDVGAPCGSTDTGECELGTSVCIGGTVQCAGEIGPVPETCNLLDDDCDGAVDEDPVDVGSPCGIATGICEPGVLVCTAAGPECQGETTGTAEVCNGIDDDCNGIIDDDPAGVDAPCGDSEGACELGLTKCITGGLECVGGFEGTTETCDGIDNDCDGEVDEGDLCDGGVCVDGECSAPCEPGEFSCPLGQMCEDGYCVDDPCFGVQCPDGPSGELNVCVDGLCLPVCDTIECPGELVCRDTDGLCVPDNCNFLPLCDEDELCVDDECVSDPCLGVSCGPRQFCRGGDCVDSCGGVECDVGAVCTGGLCEPTGCAADCEPDEVCDPSSGTCEPSPCRGSSCPAGKVCDPSSGDCVDDPCIGVDCPGAEVCYLGDCFDRLPGDEPDAGPPKEYVTAGGGGCAVGGRGAGRGAAALLLSLLAAVGLGSARRRAARRALAAAVAVAVAAFATAGCDVNEFCINCADPGARDDAAVVVHDAGIDAAPDASLGCDAGVVQQESCDGADNDCDGEIDEDFDLATDFLNCGACGVSCEKTGTRTHCEDSACAIDECFPGNVDLDGDLGEPFDESNGCEYACYVSNGGIEACDTLDNDCDGDVDEDTDFQGDEANCGECGRVCNLFKATSTCQLGECAFDPATDCEPGFHDIDGVQANGCEYACVAGGAEVCDLQDNDCDGAVDEDFDTATNPLHCGQCNRVCSFANATPSCTSGVCGFDPLTDCDPGFVDADGLQINGCEYPCTATGPEVCDLQDNDCNGVVDDAPSDAGGACHNAPGGVPIGACTETGTVVCSLGALVCVGAPAPAPELCDGVDNDCDGPVDEAPVDAGALCLSAVGVCSAGILTCSGGALDCVQAVGPSPEVCNGLDDDCNGVADDAPTDPEIGMSCGTDTGACALGSFACAGDRIVCVGGVGPALETCNGIDDDCDGTADNGVIDGGASCGSSTGACVPGTEVCVGGALTCAGGIGPTGESCNGADDDCDGTTDEDDGGGPLLDPCYTGPGGTAGVGECIGGWRVCSGGVFGVCAGEVTPVAESCNDLDDDCDGAVDDGVTQPCYTGPGGTEGIGECAAGTQTCSGGVFGACTGDVTPTGEVCDGRDQDCDGAVDEEAGGAPLTRSCYTGPGGTAGIGTCVSGTETCAFGTYGVCVGETVPDADLCGDGLDTDCDGAGDVAEGCLAISGGELRLDAPGGGQGSGVGQFHSFDVDLAGSGPNVYAVWSDLRNGASDVFFRRSTDGGLSWETIVALTTGGPGDTADAAVDPVVAAAFDPVLGADRVYVAYQTVDASDERQVLILVSSDDGASFARPSDPSNGRLDAGGDSFHHYVGLSEDGRDIVVVWEQLNTTTLTRDIESRASIDGGDSFGARRRINVNSGATPVAGRPQAGVTSGGRFVFAWRETRGGTTPNIYATYSDSEDGAIAAAAEERLDGDGADTRQSDFPQLAVVGASVYVAWQDISTLPGGGSDVAFARSVDAGGSFGAELVLDDPGGEVSSSFTPAMAVDPRGPGGPDDRVFVAWEDRREGTQIYAAVSADGGASFAAAQRASSDGGAPVGGQVRRPQVAYIGGDSVVVSYIGDAGTGVDHVFAASSVDAGATWDLTHDRLDASSRAATLPAIAPISGGGLAVGVAVAWIDFRNGAGINGDPYVRRLGR